MGDLVRVKKLTPYTPSEQWTEDGVAVDPGTVTIGITRADGTSLVAPGTATSGAAAGPRTYPLTTTHTAQLDTLTLTWTSSLKGTQTSYVEIVGGFLFAIPEARAVAPLNDATKYPTARIQEMRTLVEQSLEDACGVAFVPRYYPDARAIDNEAFAYDGTGGTHITLMPYVRDIRAVTVDGVSLSTADVVGLRAGYAYYRSGWPAGYGNVTVHYEHGKSTPDLRIKQAALILARAWLVSGPIDDRASTFSAENGVSYSLVTEDFGIPAVNEAVRAYKLNIGVA